jgi:hypothetical protein
MWDSVKSNMSGKIVYYNWRWPANIHPLELEFECIKKGGAWKRQDGQTAGMGLFYHYKKAISIWCPEFYQHRWFDALLQGYLPHEWIGIAGPKDSGKTSGLAVILLTDYWAFPTCTSIILSSNTMKSLKNRVFGEITMRFRAARRRIPWLPGHMIEGDCRIVTDEHDECVDGRDVRNGFIGIPVKAGDKKSMEDIMGIKNKRKRWMIDELQTLPAAALDGTANFMQNDADCKVIGPGNPSNISDAHGKLCQPHQSLGGWESGIDQKGKTTTWRTTFANGICIQFPGFDSPNFDIPEDQPVPFPMIMTRAQMVKDAETWGKTDWHFAMFNLGQWPRGMASNRVITRLMCINAHALDEARWAGPQSTTIVVCDAGFGGDRCVVHEMRFGRELWRPSNAGEVNASTLISQTPPEDETREVLERVATHIIPIEGNDVKEAENQIVDWCRDYCGQRRIPPDHFGYEPGMRTSLVQKMSDNWSPKCQVVDFGGKPSEGDVSYDIKVPCREYYFNFNTELWYSWRLVIECQQFRGLDAETMDEACMREYMKVGGNKIKLETKEDFKKKVGFSPDRADGIVVGVELAKRLGFVIKRQKPRDDEDGDGWMREFAEKAKKHWSSGRLQPC